ncbi:hypothetical protein PCO31111_02445 [Pandoraea communis]|uniref:Uncharacterized protein n=1 Tax=Pandoraea communis TaxID=2508297 RepID=A0A5E4V3Q7_9BURK|nr:hypothetical protein PCO31111_02445 [Pandoraea communis]
MLNWFANEGSRGLSLMMYLLMCRLFERYGRDASWTISFANVRNALMRTCVVLIRPRSPSRPLTVMNKID